MRSRAGRGRRCQSSRGPRRGALEVAQEPAGGLVEPHGAGVDEQLLLLRPGDLASHQGERIVAHGAHRADDQDGASLGGHGEQLLVLGIRRQSRHHELRGRGADGELDAGGKDGSLGGVGDLHPADGTGAHHHAMGLQIEGDPVGGLAQHEQCRDHQRHGEREGDHVQLRDVQQQADEPAGGGGADDRPADGRDHIQHGVDASQPQLDRSIAQAGEPGAGGALGRCTLLARRVRSGGGASGPGGPAPPAPETPTARLRLVVRPGSAAALLGLGLRRLRIGGVGGHGILGPHADCCRAWGGATSLRILVITLLAVVPANSASGSSTKRCSQTGSTRCLTSSGMT